MDGPGGCGGGGKPAGLGWLPGCGGQLYGSHSVVVQVTARSCPAAWGLPALQAGATEWPVLALSAMPSAGAPFFWVALQPRAAALSGFSGLGTGSQAWERPSGAWRVNSPGPHLGFTLLFAEVTAPLLPGMTSSHNPSVREEAQPHQGGKVSSCKEESAGGSWALPLRSPSNLVTQPPPSGGSGQQKGGAQGEGGCHVAGELGSPLVDLLPCIQGPHPCAFVPPARVTWPNNASTASPWPPVGKASLILPLTLHTEEWGQRELWKSWLWLKAELGKSLAGPRHGGVYL